MIGKPDSLTPPSPGEAHMQNAYATIQQKLEADDAARAGAGTTTLIATRGFTLVTDEAPLGRIVQAGEEFTVSDFDLEHFLTMGRRTTDELRADDAVPSETSDQPARPVRAFVAGSNAGDRLGPPRTHSVDGEK